MRSIEFIKLRCTINLEEATIFLFSFIRAAHETEVQCEFVTEVVENRASLEVGY